MASTVKNHEAIEAFEKFLRQYYDPEIGKLAELYPKERRSLVIDYNDLERYNPDMADRFVHNPESGIEHIQEALKDYDVPVDVNFEEANIRLKNLREQRSVSNLRSKDVNTLISVEGIVRKRTSVRPDVQEAVFECERCGTTTTIPQPDSELREPYQCNGCERQGPFSLLFDQSEFVDHQRLQIQEPPEKSDSGTDARNLEVVVRDDLPDKAKPGDRVTAVGILRAVDEGDSTTFELYMEGNNVVVEDQEFEDLDIEPDEERRIRQLARSEDIFNKIKESIAPDIHGFESEKLAMAMQMFGGVTKNLPSGTRKRGDIHMLMVGDPGTAKSALLQYIEDIAPRSVYTSGKGSTDAGLTAAAIKDDFGDTKWTLEAGALVLADKGMACVDELDKMSDDDQSALHEALAEGQVTITKAAKATLKSRCSLLAAANPEHGRFDQYASVAEQIDLEPSLISRFDFIFTVMDNPNKQEDSELAEHLAKVNYAGSVKASEGDIPEDCHEVEPEIEPELFKKYIAYARANISPVLTDEAAERMNEFYVDLRAQSGDNEKRVSITPRKLEAMYRVAEASARVRLSEVVELQDAQRAIDLITESLRDVAYDPETGELDADIVETGQSSSQRERAKAIENAVRSLSAKSDEGKASVEEVFDWLDGEYDDERVRATLEIMKKNGKVIEPSDGHYRPV